MKNCNRRSFIHVFFAATAAAVLLPRKAARQVLGLSGSAGEKTSATAMDFSAAAALVKQAPNKVAHSPRARRTPGSV